MLVSERDGEEAAVGGEQQGCFISCCQRLLENKRKHCVATAVLSLFVRDVIVTVEFNIHPEMVNL